MLSPDDGTYLRLVERLRAALLLSRASSRRVVASRLGVAEPITLPAVGVNQSLRSCRALNMSQRTMRSVMRARTPSITMKHEEPGARRGAPALRYGGVNGRRDAA